MLRVVVAYDISSDRRRQEVAKQLENILPRVQRSVFEGKVPAEKLHGCLAKLVHLLDPATDSIRVYPLCARCKEKVGVHGHRADRDDETVRVI